MNPSQRIYRPFRLLLSLIPYIENTTYRLKNRSGINLTPPSDCVTRDAVTDCVTRDAVSENDGSKNTPNLNDSAISKKKGKYIVNKKWTAYY